MFFEEFTFTPPTFFFNFQKKNFRKNHDLPSNPLLLSFSSLFPPPFPKAPCPEEEDPFFWLPPQKERLAFLNAPSLPPPTTTTKVGGGFFGKENPFPPHHTPLPWCLSACQGPKNVGPPPIGLKKNQLEKEKEEKIGFHPGGAPSFLPYNRLDGFFAATVSPSTRGVSRGVH
jgi:hypothetical protein